MLKVLVAENRTLDFHTHDESDELFYVIDGVMTIEFAAARRQVRAGEFLIVPRGLRHRPVVTSRVTCLLIEKRGTLNPGNTGGGYR